MTLASMLPLPAPPAPPRAVLFDWDNTLVDSWGTIHHAWNVTLAAMGHPTWTLEETRERVRHSIRDSFPRRFGARWEEARRLYLDAFTAVHLERLSVLPGAAALIEELAADGLYLAVVSNKTGPVLRREAERLGWTRHFGRLIGATDATADKPELAPVELALGGSGVVRGPEVWFVGDTGLDMQCAIGAGCVPVLVGAHDPDEPDLARWPPALTFADCGALASYLKGLRSAAPEPTC
jgi:phosphoglycolate phosphatase